MMATLSTFLPKLIGTLLIKAKIGELMKVTVHTPVN